MRQLRGELEGREKALELARRTVERLMAEKGSLEAGAAGALGPGRLGCCAMQRAWTCVPRGAIGAKSREVVAASAWVAAEPYAQLRSPSWALLGTV